MIDTLPHPLSQRRLRAGLLSALLAGAGLAPAAAQTAASAPAGGFCAWAILPKAKAKTVQSAAVRLAVNLLGKDMGQGFLGV